MSYFPQPSYIASTRCTDYVVELAADGNLICCPFKKGCLKQQWKSIKQPNGFIKITNVGVPGVFVTANSLSMEENLVGGNVGLTFMTGGLNSPNPNAEVSETLAAAHPGQELVGEDVAVNLKKDYNTFSFCTSIKDELGYWTATGDTTGAQVQLSEAKYTKDYQLDPCQRWEIFKA